jgi:alanine-glyoxylate transaminase/serine-glyoxylate transaminase/serine-pyruvate transaminase
VTLIDSFLVRLDDYFYHSMFRSVASLALRGSIGTGRGVAQSPRVVPFGSAVTVRHSSNSHTNSSSHTPERLRYNVIPKSDFGAFKEYSVIHTDRSLNLMSDPFQRVMRDLNELLKVTYNADKVVILPGSGTFGMEAVARQFAQNEHVMVIRNGWFSYRWTEIFEMGSSEPGVEAGGVGAGIPTSHTVLKAQPVPVPGNDTGSNNTKTTHFAPHPIQDVVSRIHQERPAVLFAPHVETSTGMMLPDEYIQKAAQAMHDIGGLFVLDCIASGTVWVDMKALGVDVLISAPQKGWTGPPCAALVMMSDRAVARMSQTSETSFSMSLKRWAALMDTYEKGGFAYHTTMPTDALRDFHEISVETLRFGLPELKTAQLNLGWWARGTLDRKGLVSVAAPGFQAPGVLVYYSPSQTDNPVMMSSFKAQGLQIAMGVPWKIDEPEGLKTFRIGLFGLDKLGKPDETIRVMEEALDQVLDSVGHTAKSKKVA